MMGDEGMPNNLHREIISTFMLSFIRSQQMDFGACDGVNNLCDWFCARRTFQAEKALEKRANQPGK